MKKSVKASEITPRNLYLLLQNQVAYILKRYWSFSNLRDSHIKYPIASCPIVNTLLILSFKSKGHLPKTILRQYSLMAADITTSLVKLVTKRTSRVVEPPSCIRR